MSDQQIRFQWLKALLCRALRHKCVLDVNLRMTEEGGLQPWRIRCVSCGAINPFTERKK